MIMRSVILISQRQPVIDFFKDVAKEAEVTLIALPDWEKVSKLTSSPALEYVVCWDLEGGKPESDPQNPAQITAALNTIPQAVRERLRPERCVALTTESIYRHDDFASSAALLRKHFHNTMSCPLSGSGKQVYHRLFKALLDPAPRGLSLFFPADMIERVNILSPKHRPAAADAVQSLLTKKGYSTRLAAKVAQASDELLMNAIFDAAVDGFGQRIRQKLDRAASFEFLKNEQVFLEIAYNADFVGVCVSDFHGSLELDQIFSHIDKDYVSNRYTPIRSKPSTGLGLYGMVNSGFSLFITGKHRVRTDCMLFFPNSLSFIDAKNSFHFTSVLNLKTGA